MNQSAVVLYNYGLSINSNKQQLVYRPTYIVYAHIVSSFGLLQQQYADDTQIYFAVSRFNQSINILQLERCLSALHTWFCLNGFALNPRKSEVILMDTRQRAASLPSLSNISR